MRHIRHMIGVLLVILFAGPAAADTCFDCHKDVTPGVTDRWELSAHARANVGCIGCHGSDVKANHNRTVRAEPNKCGTCHKNAFAQWEGSGHGVSDGPYKALCSDCHTAHGTSALLSARPEVCARCHADARQYETWQTSAHGAAYAAGGTLEGPNCVSCHMYDGTHDVSKAIASGKPSDRYSDARKVMLDACTQCHPPALARRALDGADTTYNRVRAIVDEARDVLNVLWRDGLVAAAPPEDAGVLTGRSELSRIEALYLKMHREAPVTAQTAFHRMGGNAGDRLDTLLAELKGEEREIRRLASIEERLGEIVPVLSEEGLTPDELKDRLRKLKHRLDTGAITPVQYRTLRDELLDKAGL